MHTHTQPLSNNFMIDGDVSLLFSPPGPLLVSWGAVRSEEVDVLLVSPGGQTKMKNVLIVLKKQLCMHEAALLCLYFISFFYSFILRLQGSAGRGQQIFRGGFKGCKL